MCNLRILVPEIEVKHKKINSYKLKLKFLGKNACVDSGTWLAACLGYCFPFCSASGLPPVKADLFW